MLSATDLAIFILFSQSQRLENTEDVISQSVSYAIWLKVVYFLKYLMSPKFSDKHGERNVEVIPDMSQLFEFLQITNCQCYVLLYFCLHEVAEICEQVYEFVTN